MRSMHTALICCGVGCALSLAPLAHAAEADATGVAEKPAVAKDEGKKEAKDAETEEMKQAMAKKVSFEFEDAALSDSINFLQSLTSVSMIVDPKLKADEHKFTLKAKDMPLREALVKFAATAGAKVYVKDGAYYIGTEAPEGAQKIRQEPEKLTEAQVKVVEEAIKNLSSDDFSTREAASRAIADAGTGALPQLQAAMKQTDDVEAQSRLKELVQVFLEQLGGDEGSEALNKALERKVSFEFIDTPLSETITFLNSLVRNSGAKIEVSDTAPRDAAINLRVTDMKLGMALEWLAKLADCHLVKSGGTVTVKRK